MPLRKKVGYVGLKDLSYSLIDTDIISRDYFNVVEFPNRLTAGKNLIKLKANPDVLVNNSQIHIEILDFNGNPIYYEPLNYVEKDGTRVVAIYVYPDTAPGRATIYLAGRALINVETGEQYPYSKDYNNVNYLNTPNVIWRRNVTVAPKARNKTEIIFTRYPIVTLSEVVQPYLQPVEIFNVYTQVTGSGESTVRIEPIGSGPPYGGISNPNALSTLASVEGGASPATPSFGTQFFNTAPNDSVLRESQGATSTSPILTTLNGSSRLKTSGFALNSNMVGGIIEIVNPNITPDGTSNTGAQISFPISNGLLLPKSQQNELGSFFSVVLPGQITPLSGSYKFAITSVFNSSTALVSQIEGFRNDEDNTYGPWSVQLASTGGTSNFITAISASVNFTASFTQPSAVVQTQRSSSFGDIILANIEPATGDVYKVKTLYKPSGFFGDFIDLGDTILEEYNALVDTGSYETNISVGVDYERYGSFEDLAEIEQYWTSASISSSGSPVNLWHPFQYDDDVLIGGAELSMSLSLGVGPAGQDGFNVGEAAVFSINPIYAPTVYADTEYLVKFAVANNTDAASVMCADIDIPNHRLDVYVSGSSIEKQNESLNVQAGEIFPVPNFNNTLTGDFRDNGPLGTRIGTYQIKPIPEALGYVELRFKALETKPIDLKFVIRNGSFIIGEIELVAIKETGFSPNFTRIFKRIPTEHLGTPLTFKFQFFDYESKKADLEMITYGAIFDGDNTYIQGVNNLITGSVYLSNEIGTGIQQSGERSGYIRSVGYQGFLSASIPELSGSAGWMMWSGSVLPNSGDGYTGVGLELVADSGSYLQFRTGPPSIFIVRTETFFFGSDNQFISGANGNIEISSSNFHLTAEGNVTASNALFTGVALANIILDQTAIITAANSGSYLREEIDIGTTNKDGYTIILDGSEGGEIVRRVRINCELKYPIYDVQLTDVNSNSRIDVVIENSVAGNQIYDVFNPKTKGLAASLIEVTLRAGDIIILAPGGAGAADWVCIGGTLQPFSGYDFKRGLTVSASTNAPFYINNLPEDEDNSTLLLTYNLTTGKVFYTASTAAGSSAVTGITEGNGINVSAPVGNVTIDVDYADVADNIVGGSNRQIQFNDGGTAFSGSSNFTFDKNTNTVNLTGSLIIRDNLTVLGTASIQHVTSSQLNISTNLISVNTYAPIVRFGGLAVIDSGSSPQRSGSILFDSQNNQWIFVHSNTGGQITSSVFIQGPQTFNNVGNETTLTTNRLTKATGGDLGEHIGNSNITDDGTTITMSGSVVISGSIQITGSLNTTGSVFLKALQTSSTVTNILTYNPTTGQVFYTASSAVGGGGTGGTGYVLYTTSSVVGNGTATTWDVVHNFGSREVTVSVYQSGSNGESVYPTIRRPDGNTVRTIFNSPPSLAEYVVYVSYLTTVGSGTGTFQSDAFVIGNTSDTTFDMAHNFGTRDVHVTIFESGSNGETVYTTVRRTDVNTVRAIFNTPPDTLEYVVYVSS